MKIRRLTDAALFVAVICVATMITIVVETAKRRFSGITFRNFQTECLKATNDCNVVGK